jgi:alpha-beta hydrolase superfamily lysophospholipase
MIMDFNIKLSNGQVLRGMIQSPGENPKAVIVLVHGIGEHIQRYVSWADLFRKEGFAFTGVDLPGHGRSEGRRGHIKSYKLLEEMINILLTSCRKTFPGIPVYLYGQSLGGGIVVDYMIRVNPKIKGAIVSSPWLGLSFEPARIKLIIASAMKNLMPGLVQNAGLNVSHLSHNVVVGDNYKSDPLVHYKISLSLFHSAMNAARNSLKRASDLKIPTLVMHGSDDLITSPESSREFVKKSGKAVLRIWEGGYHELHNESFKDEVFKFIIDWIDKNQN